MFSKKIETIAFGSTAAVALAVIFFIYSTYRQQYVGACDWYGYYQQAQLFKSGHITLETKLPALKYPSIAPLSFYAENGKVLGQYPPGFPLLMAVAGLVGLEFFVNPFLGVLSVILMFLINLALIGKDKGKDKWTAGLFALLWAFFPLTTYGSTYVMSDLPGTFFILLAFYLFKKKKLIPSALSLAFSLAVRPSNVLFCVAFLPLVWQELKTKERWQYSAGFTIASSLYAIYNWLVYGLPWKTGYMDISHYLSTTIFTRNMQYYTGETLTQFAPLLLILAVIALWKKEKYAFFLAAWFLVFFIFYCFWEPYYNVWWWQRFLLPGFPALFLLATLGFKRILVDVRLKVKILNYTVSILLVTVVLSNGIYFIYRGTHYSELWAKNKGKLYYVISKKIAKKINPGSLVGSCDFTGSLRLYTNTETFCYYNPNSLNLISDMLKEGKPVYIAVEPWQKKNPGVQWIFKNFKIKKIANVGVDAWSDFFLYRILKQKYQELLIPPL